MSQELTPYLRAYHSSSLRLRNSPGMDYPAHVHMETYAKCNAACNFCPYPGLERQGVRMSDTLIQKIIDDLGDIPRIHGFQLSPFKVSEPFLDHRLFDILTMIESQLPNAVINLTSNASPITVDKLARLGKLSHIDSLWISFNDHREAEYEAAMQLPYARTLERLAMIHQARADGRFSPRVILSRVSDDSAVDQAFCVWVKNKYPLFEVAVFPRGRWLGQTDMSPLSPVDIPNVACTRWFELSITATGVVAHCCMDGQALFPIGDVHNQHVLEIYNNPEYRRLRESTVTRLDASPCRNCNFL